MSVVNLEVQVAFGYTCGNKCECQTMGKGRRYPVSVKSTDLVSEIWNEMARQNPLITEKKIKPFLYYKREILELERRVISYDFEPKAEVTCIMPSLLCCSTPFRRAPTEKERKEPQKQKLMQEAKDLEQGPGDIDNSS